MVDEGTAGPSRRRRTVASAALVVVVLSLVTATFDAGVKKNLVGTLNCQEWGRYVFAFAAALTQQRFGITGYVTDRLIQQNLRAEGLTDSDAILPDLGLTFPENLNNPQVLRRALERARDFELRAAAPSDFTRLRGPNGDDVGIATFTSLAFWLFGVDVSSLYYTYFTLLVVAIFLFLLGHYQSPGALACLEI